MTELISLYNQHPVLTTLVAYGMFSNLVGALETPDEKSGKFYRFVYRFAHGLAFNWKYAMRAKFPDLVPEGNDEVK